MMKATKLQDAIGEIDARYITEAHAEAPCVKTKAKQLPWRKLGGIALAACLAICAVVGVGILMKNATPPVSADPGIPDVCAEQGHDYSIVKEVTTGRIILQCSICESTKNLYDEIDESEYDSDESHFIYMDQIEAFGVLPGYVTSNPDAFTGQDYYQDWIGEEIGNEGDICVIGYTGTSSKVKIPSQIDGKNVISVCLAYNDNDENITSIIFSEGIAAIYGSTGYNWKNLESVYFSDGLRTIAGTTPLKVQQTVQPDVEVEICGGVESDFIGVHATPFRNCPKLTEIYFPDGFVNFGTQPIFTRCTGITRYYLPASYSPKERQLPVLFVNAETDIISANGKECHGRFYTNTQLIQYEDGCVMAYHVGEDCKDHGANWALLNLPCVEYYQYSNGKLVQITDLEGIAQAIEYLRIRDCNEHYVDR